MKCIEHEPKTLKLVYSNCGQHRIAGFGSRAWAYMHHWMIQFAFLQYLAKHDSTTFMQARLLFMPAHHVFHYGNDRATEAKISISAIAKR